MFAANSQRRALVIWTKRGNGKKAKGRVIYQRLPNGEPSMAWAQHFEARGERGLLLIPLACYTALTPGTGRSDTHLVQALSIQKCRNDARLGLLYAAHRQWVRGPQGLDEPFNHHGTYKDEIAS